MITEHKARFTPAASTAVLGWILVVTAGFVLMAVLAMRLTHVVVNDVLLMRNVHQMVWIHAPLVKAGVIKLFADGDIISENLKRNNVSLDAPKRTNVNPCVASFAYVASPIPASSCGVQFDLVHQSINQRSCVGHKKKSTRVPKVMPAEEIAAVRTRVENSEVFFILKGSSQAKETVYPNPI